jgi:hypothetical protein
MNYSSIIHNQFLTTEKEQCAAKKEVTDLRTKLDQQSKRTKMALSQLSEGLNSTSDLHSNGYIGVQAQVQMP